MLGRTISDVTLKTRVRDESVGGDNPFGWQDIRTADLVRGRRIVEFSLPGAFTPTCTTEQCPAFERHYDLLRAAGIEEVYCVSVNDAFVMYQWGKHLGLDKVKLLPDGSGDFTRRMGMLIRKDHLGFGNRSRRYAMVVDHAEIVAWIEEPGINDDGIDDDPHEASSPDCVLAWLQRSGNPVNRPPE
jgi:thioredoxin-dependent peroxiredoxin